MSDAARSYRLGKRCCTLRLWDLERGTQIGEDWRDEEDEAGVRSMALSPNGTTIASGCDDWKVRIWDVETRKVIAKWSGHTDVAGVLCWSVDGSQVLSGSWDGWARVWGCRERANCPGHQNRTQVGACGNILARCNETRNWWQWRGCSQNLGCQDGRAGSQTRYLAWTSNGKLISGSYNRIRILDTATWQQIANLSGSMSSPCLRMNNCIHR